MKRCVSRLSVAAVTLAIGALIGFAGSQSLSQGGANAQASERAAGKAKKVARYGSVIGVKRETLDEYVRIHKKIWPGVEKMIADCNIRNYSIYLGELDDGNLYLFSYFEYIGDDFDAEMQKMKDDETTRKWWKVTDPMQIPQKNRKEGEHWMTMQEVFHQD